MDYCVVLVTVSREAEAKTIARTLDVHFISSLPVLQRPACMAWADTRCVQIVGAES